MEYPATRVVHWPSGPVNACDKHAAEIVALGRFMGAHTPQTLAAPDAECSNCLNENQAEKEKA